MRITNYKTYRVFFNNWPYSQTASNAEQHFNLGKCNVSDIDIRLQSHCLIHMQISIHAFLNARTRHRTGGSKPNVVTRYLYEHIVLQALTCTYKFGCTHLQKLFKLE